MTHYRRNRVPGQAYFFTVRLRERRSTLLTEHIAAFGEAIRQARGRKPFHVDAWVVLPDHAHAIWTLPPGDHDCASRWRAVKIAFTKAVGKSRSRRPGERALWERHYHDQRIADDEHYRQMVDYVHASPVAQGLCGHPAEWPWSSLHRFVAEGFIISPENVDVLILPPSPSSRGSSAARHTASD